MINKAIEISEKVINKIKDKLKEIYAVTESPKDPKDYNCIEIFKRYDLSCGRMISAHKTCPDGQKCVFNANAIIKSKGKIWFGDLNLTKEGNKLKEIAKEIGEPIYILRESDCRFRKECDPINELISKSVWNTEI